MARNDLRAGLQKISRGGSEPALNQEERLERRAARVEADNTPPRRSYAPNRPRGEQAEDAYVAAEVMAEKVPREAVEGPLRAPSTVAPGTASHQAHTQVPSVSSVPAKRKKGQNTTPRVSIELAQADLDVFLARLRTLNGEVGDAAEQDICRIGLSYLAAQSDEVILDRIAQLPQMRGGKGPRPDALKKRMTVRMDPAENETFRSMKRRLAAVQGRVYDADLMRATIYAAPEKADDLVAAWETLKVS